MSLQPHEIELSRREQDERNAEIEYSAFKLDAIYRAKFCLKTEGDLVDLINELDLEWMEDDDHSNLSNVQINEIVMTAARWLTEESRSAA